MRGEEIGATGTSMLAMENPDTGWVYPRATMKEKRAARASEVWWRAPTTCFILSHDSGTAKSYQIGF